MGLRGPQPQPANVHLLRGNPSKLPISQLLGEFKPEVAIPGAPEYLSKEGRTHWDNITPELERYGLICLLDGPRLAQMCQALGRIDLLEKQIAKLNAADPVGQPGWFSTAPSGYRMPSVELQSLRVERDFVGKVCLEFGLTPSARSRVTPSDNQPFLPGMGPGEKGNETPPPQGLAKFATP